MTARRVSGCLLALVLGLWLWSPPACGLGAPAPFDLTQLMARLGTVKSGSARFTEQRYLHMLKAPLEDSGILVYEAPDKLQKQTLLPRPENMVIEGDVLTIDAEGKQQTLSLTDYPQLGAFIEGIRATLAGNRTALERIYDTQLHGSLDAWVLRLSPRDPAMQAIVSSISISGSGTRIGQVETVEHDGDRTVMTIAEGNP
ncbi:MAG TPA: LolA-related protein [Stellaceae bacterium]|jgi:outer membrane lipoprotein-sorting protein